MDFLTQHALMDAVLEKDEPSMAKIASPAMEMITSMDSNHSSSKKRSLKKKLPREKVEAILSDDIRSERPQKKLRKSQPSVKISTHSTEKESTELSKEERVSPITIISMQQQAPEPKEMTLPSTSKPVIDFK
jgi:hypothetical protein